VPPGPPAAAAATPADSPAASSSSSSSKQQGGMQGLTIKPVQPQGAPHPPYAVTKPPPAGSTKLVSAGPSASSIDVEAPVAHPGRAVIEVAAGSGLEPLDLLGDVAQELQQQQQMAEKGTVVWRGCRGSLCKMKL
jgi:hypothetical protein